MANVSTWNSSYELGHNNGMQDKKTAETMGMMHKGGKVKKTGPYRLRKGEVVLTVGQQREAGLKPSKKKSGTKKRTTSKR